MGLDLIELGLSINIVQTYTFRSLEKPNQLVFFLLN